MQSLDGARKGCERTARAAAAGEGAKSEVAASSQPGGAEGWHILSPLLHTLTHVARVELDYI